MALEKGLTERKRYRQMRIRDYRAKTRLSTENGALLNENQLTERKRAKALLTKAKTRFPSENATNE